MKKDIIFYSWQADLPNADNRNFIKECIEKAVKEANRDDKCLEVDRDTSGMAGAPNIQQTILKKIEKANVFVADISIISEMSSEERRTPNPNVLFELGYAAKALGWERIICVFNEDYGKIEELPFDIKQHRILPYSLKDKEKKDVKSYVINAIKGNLDILAMTGLIYCKARSNGNYLVEAPTDDIFYSDFASGDSVTFFIDSVKSVDFFVNEGSQGVWEIVGEYEGRGYNFFYDFLNEIDYQRGKIQVTCIDLDKDGNKEVLVSIGAGVELETNIYRFIPDSEKIFELNGRILGQEKMIIDINRSMIIAPYGGQGLYEEYKYLERRLWRPVPEVKNKIFA